MIQGPSFHTSLATAGWHGKLHVTMTVLPMANRAGRSLHVAVPVIRRACTGLRVGECTRRICKGRGRAHTWRVAEVDGERCRR